MVGSGNETSGIVGSGNETSGMVGSGNETSGKALSDLKTPVVVFLLLYQFGLFDRRDGITSWWFMWVCLA